MSPVYGEKTFALSDDTPIRNSLRYYGDIKNIGLMPITGIPLPFMSSGTSFMPTFSRIWKSHIPTMHATISVPCRSAA